MLNAFSKKNTKTRIYKYAIQKLYKIKKENNIIKCSVCVTVVYRSFDFLNNFVDKNKITKTELKKKKTII